MNVNEVSKLMGISIRTLHYYDEIGLLKPERITDVGHRVYSHENIVKLKEILLFKELGIHLKGIKKILESSNYDSKQVMEAQKQLLIIKRDRLNHLIENISKLSYRNSESELDISESEWELVWNEIYHKQGEVQKGILPTVVEAVKNFKDCNVKKVLDLGCGMGRHSIYLKEAGFDVTACDISEKAVETTKKKFERLGYDLDTAVCDMRALPFKEETFDAVLCVWTSGHGTLEDMKKHASEMRRVVKENGIIFVDYPSIEDERYGIGTEIEANTFLDNMPGEEKIPHHYSDEKEIEKVYDGDKKGISPYTYSFYDRWNNDHLIKAYVCTIEKNL
jgi:DNA-binding transcriptional MerR regulator/ubiquinone/menaquinone biosynthesis C-methylase UbiE